MAKNIIKLPTRRIGLPKSKKIINLRSLTVKEQNLIKLGMTSKDKYTVSSTLKNVIESCITEKINVTKLSIVDIEFIFLQLLKMSSGRYIDVGYTCTALDKDGNTCGHHNEVQFDLDESNIELKDDEDVKKFQITDEVWLEFRKLNTQDMFESFASVAVSEEQELNEEEELKEKYTSCLHTVIDGEEIIEAKSLDKDDKWSLIEWIPIGVAREIDDFISGVDRITLEKKFKCHKCGHESHVKYEGLEDFLV